MNVFYYVAEGSAAFEIVQRLAFSLGWTWGDGSFVLKETKSHKTIISFDRETKVMSINNNPPKDISPLTDLVDLLFNLKLSTCSINGALVYDNGVVEIFNHKFSKSQFDEIIKAREQMMSDETTTPERV